MPNDLEPGVQVGTLGFRRAFRYKADLHTYILGIDPNDSSRTSLYRLSGLSNPSSALVAYDVKPAASLLYNAAVCYEKARRYRYAGALFERYLEANPSTRDRVAVEQRIALLVRAADRERSPRATPTSPRTSPGP